jgi:NAD(P)-dependent dehydrogenase (short-subunit alcohol dehydrogenase family)
MDLNSVLVTGAASGIGRSLALACAAPGHTLNLCDLNAAGLAETAAQCRAAGATVLDRVLDVSDAPAMQAWIQGCGRLDLVLGCAGVQFTSLVGDAETPAQVRRTFDVNLIGALNTALPALETMAAQPLNAEGVRGRIALLASLGAFVSVPGASAYSASKAAVDNWTVGRAALARRQGIYLTSICPGYVRTPLSAMNGYPMHGLMEPEEAARIILKRLSTAPVRLGFPWRMVAAAKFGGLLPAGFPARMLARNHARKQAAS